MLKFGYSEKATKFEKVFQFDATQYVEDFLNFVAFSEYLNLIKPPLSVQ